MYKSGDFVRFDHENAIRIGRLVAIVKEEGEWQLEINALLTYGDLPKTLRSSQRQSYAANGMLWLGDERPILIEPQNIIGNMTVWFEDSPHRPLSYEYYVKEIVYLWNACWRVCHVSYRHRHPSGYIRLPQLPGDIPIKKIFLDLYHDDFGTFRSVYHSLGGVYLQFGNMPQSMWKQLKNHFPIRFVPFGGSFNDFIRPFIKELQKLEKGVKMTSLGQEVWVVTGLGSITADLPQGNVHAGVKHHSGIRGCRFCKAPRESLTNPSFDVLQNARYHHITDIEIAKINQETGIARSRLATEYGLRLHQSPFDAILHDRHINTPHDPYHAIGGKILKLLDVTMNLLSASGEDVWNMHWKAIEKPIHWWRLPNPLTHRQSFLFSDGLRLMMLIPFILCRFLLPCHIKNASFELLKENLGVREDQVVPELIGCWVIVAKTTKLSFSASFTEQKYNELAVCLSQEKDILVKVFTIFFL